MRRCRAALLPLLENAYAEQIRRDDARLETGYLDYGGIRCYVARPKATAARLPAVVVIHENRGLNPHIEDVARRAALESFTALERGQAIPNLVAVVDALAARADNVRIGCIGFCWGGGMANQLALHSPRIKARLLLHFAERDSRINTGVPAYEGALKAAGVQHAIHMYPGTDHAFHNDTAGARYNKEAAELAWSRTIAFLKDALR
jgi:carboxymethylenebutenolidase